MRVRALSRAAAAIVIVVGGFLAVTSTNATAATNPIWEPDTQAVGTLTFYDASGNVVTSGSTTSQLATYAVGSAYINPTHVSAAIFAAQPNPSAATGNWNTEQWTAFDAYPLTTGPSAIQTLSQTHPVATIGSNDENLSQFILDFPNTGPTGTGCAYSATPSGCTNTSYQNIYQIRLLTAAGSGTFSAASYDDADVLVSGTTWTQIYPTPPTGPASTTTSLTPSPASPQTAGTSVTLSAQVTPSTAAGTVTFFDGSNAIGSPVTVSSGTASTSTSTLSVGTHSLTAVFTPSDTTAFATSTSSAVSYTINAAVASTATTLDITPQSPVTVGAQSTLTAHVTPSTAAGSVTFFDGTATIGSAVTVSGGTASTNTTFATGDHSVTAVFTPSDPTAFSGSTSSASSYTVNPLPATTTTTALGVVLMTPQTYGEALGLTATVTPSTAVGSVNFLDGSTVIGSPVPLSGGTASINPTTLSAGTHSITAQFVPTDPTAFGASQSDPSSVSVDAASTTTALDAAPSGTQSAGSPVTLTATVSPSAAPGQVEFFDGSNSLGTAAVSGGTATTTLSSLTGGSHSLTATYTPTGSNYTTSTSAAVSYSITAATTTTTLAVSPTSPAASGATETLNATLTPSAATGTVQFMDGSNAIGSPVAVSGGHASTTDTLAGGTHSLTAVFTSSDTTSYSNSSSDATSYEVREPATTTTTSLTVSPADSVLLGDDVTLTATVTPSTAVGSVTFYDGSKAIGSSIDLVGGTATITTSSLALGSHSLKAVFTPTSAADFTTSSSAAATLEVNTATIDGVTSGGSPLGAGDTVKPGQSITIDASGFTPGATVTETLHSTPVTLGTATADASGAVHVTVALPSSITPGNHTIILSDGTHTASFPIVVPSSASSSSSSSSSGGGSLAHTGFDVSAGLTAGLLLFGVGVFLLLGTGRGRNRRRRGNHAAR